MRELLESSIYTAVDDAGTALETRKASKSRVLTHAVVLQAEKMVMVKRRHTARLVEDEKLLEALREAAASDPVVRTAGQLGAGKIMVQPPLAVRGIVDVVYADQSNLATARKVYDSALREAESKVLERIAESTLVLHKVEARTYILQGAKVISWCTSHSAARVRIRVFESSAREPWYLLGLKMTSVLKPVPS